MFQNIDVKNADTTVNEEESNYNKGKFEVFNRIIGQALTKQNLLLYLISFMMSMVSCGDGIAPFGMAIFAAACSNSVPVIFIYIVTMIGTALKFGSAGEAEEILINSPPMFVQALANSCPLSGAIINTCIFFLLIRSAINCSKNVFPAPVVPIIEMLAFLYTAELKISTITREQFAVFTPIRIPFLSDISNDVNG